ncbi:PAP2 superfamily protein [Tritrichomonas foetus]|uniref:PAP2 superfamily protein n=1 Tax=Tritrichomonas foetus TaxID=1144522 RepID=A0A1J4JFF1_9EUKA|nr:PAP2 superfamily protein [Tritrichomonas foetus]|eukprot:OHS97942.1 PAP2 superfamily protein [Tritrichomonas foetus]
MSSKYPPFPGKPPQTKKFIEQQHKVWDAIHNIELPIIIFIQKVFNVSQTIIFWDTVSRIGRAKPISLTPLILFALGKYEKAKHLSKSLIFFSLLSSIGKLVMKRRRPGSYPEVYALCCSSSSSFPSRHMIGFTIVSYFFPFRWFFIILMMIDRIVTGLHYPSDCFFGYLLGEISLVMAKYIFDANLIVFLLFLAVIIWPNGGKILSGAFPIIIAPDVVISKFTFPLIL